MFLFINYKLICLKCIFLEATKTGAIDVSFSDDEEDTSKVHFILDLKNIHSLGF